MSADGIARLKVTLDEVKPPVLRRIEVPLAIRLDRLHLALQSEPPDPRPSPEGYADLHPRPWRCRWCAQPAPSAPSGGRRHARRVEQVAEPGAVVGGGVGRRPAA